MRTRVPTEGAREVRPGGSWCRASISELGAKLVAARSFPESAEACQQWMAQRVKMAAEDGQRFATDSQKFMEATARMFSNGWSGGSI